MIRFKKEKGYTLVETIIAVLFLGIALIAMASAFINASYILQKSRHTLTAVSYLQKWAEFYRNEAFSDITTCTNISLDISGAPLPASPLMYITIQDYDADGDFTSDTDIKKISMKIEWDERGTPVTKKMATLIAQQGINP